MNDFILAIQFLTRIPLTHKSVPAEPENFQGAAVYFTLIGAMIGLIQYGVFCGAKWLFPPLLVALLVTLSGMIVTGGIHLDGLADIFDGFGAQANRERTFEIMKDSRVGTFGVLALIVDFSYHFIGYYLLLKTPIFYILIPMLGKLSQILLCRIGKNAKKGMGALWIENISSIGVGVNSILAIGISFIVLQSVINTFILIGTVVIGTVLLCGKYTRKLGGLTGDTLGATQQLIEWLVITLLIGLL